jgi:hypothetical protein
MPRIVSLSNALKEIPPFENTVISARKSGMSFICGYIISLEERPKLNFLVDGSYLANLLQWLLLTWDGFRWLVRVL